jgi:hypothetical protein
MEPLVVGKFENAVRLVAHHLNVFLGCGFGSIPRSRLDGDASLEYAAKVGDAQQEDEQHRQDEGELDECLPLVMMVPSAIPTSPQVSQ